MEHTITGQHLCVDTDMGFWEAGETQSKGSEEIFLEAELFKFQQDLELKGNRFTLRGVVAFCQPATRSSLGHYIDYCKRSDFHLGKKYDLSNGMAVVNSHTKICRHAVLYSRVICL